VFLQVMALSVVARLSLFQVLLNPSSCTAHRNIALYSILFSGVLHFREKKATARSGGLKLPP